MCLLNKISYQSFKMKARFFLVTYYVFTEQDNNGIITRVYLKKIFININISSKREHSHAK